MGIPMSRRQVEGMFQWAQATMLELLGMDARVFVSVKTNSGEMYEIPVQDKDTIADLREKLFLETGIEPDRQSIYCFGYHIDKDEARILDLMKVAREFGDGQPYLVVFSSSLPWNKDSTQSFLDTDREVFIISREMTIPTYLRKRRIIELTELEKKLVLIYPTKRFARSGVRTYQADYYEIQYNGHPFIKIEEDRYQKNRLSLIVESGERLLSPRSRQIYNELAHDTFKASFETFCKDFMKSMAMEMLQSEGKRLEEEESSSLAASKSHHDQRIVNQEKETEQKDIHVMPSKQAYVIPQKTKQTMNTSWKIRSLELEKIKEQSSKKDMVIKAIQSNDVTELKKLEMSVHHALADVDYIFIASRHGSLECLRLMAKDWINLGINIRDKDGKTPLMWAAEMDHVQVVRFLVTEASADVNARDNYRRTALMWAAAEGRLGSLRFLAEEADADVGARDNHGKTALMLAAKKGYLSALRFLVEEADADVSAKSDSGMTALHYACLERRMEPVRYLVEAAKADVKIKCKFGITPLHCACLVGSLRVVRFIMGKYEGSWQDTYTMDGQTELHLACLSQSLSLCRYLIEECGANVILKGYYPYQNKLDSGLTPLHFACRGEDVQTGLIFYLVKKVKLDCNAQSTLMGWTPLHVLKRYCPPNRLQEAGSQVLIDCGADESIRDAAGKLWHEVEYIKS